MNKYLRAAIEAVLRDADGCSADNLGYIQCMNSSNLAILRIEFEKDCRKHGKFPRQAKKP